MVYLVSVHKLPRKGISYVKTKSKAKAIEKRHVERTGRALHVYKVSAPRRRHR